MKPGKIIILLYIVAGVGASVLCGKMLTSIQSFSPERIIFVETESTVMRTEPSEGSLALIDLQKGDKLEFVKSVGGGWLQVRNGSFEGYVRTGETSMRDDESGQPANLN